MQKIDDRIHFGFNVVMNARKYLEVVAIVPNSSAAGTKLKIGARLICINYYID